MSNTNADALSRCPLMPAPNNGIAEAEIQVAAVPSSGDQPTRVIQELLKADHVRVRTEGLAAEQQRDKELVEILLYLENGELPPEAKQAHLIVLQSPLFSIVDGILFLVSPTKKNCSRRAVVPRHLRGQLMVESHRGPMGVHFSGNRLFHVLATHWWWDGMYGDVIKFV